MNRKYAVLTVLSILSVITFLDRNAISLAGQRITTELGLTESQFGWILSAFTISYGLFEIPGGRLGDRFGPRKILARVVLWWSFFTFLTGWAGGFMSLFVIRFLFGAGEAGAYPNTAIVVRQWFPALERGGAQAMIWMASRIGGTLAPLIVIPLQSYYGWRMSFYVLAAVGAVWVIGWLWWYKAQDEKHIPTEAHSTVDWGRWLKSVNFWLLMAMYFCYAAGVFFFISWLPKYLQNGRGLTEGQLVFSASLPFLLGAAGCLLGGWMSDRLVVRYGTNTGRRIVPLVGLCLSGTMMICSALTENNDIAVIAVAFGMAFMDVTAPVAWAVAIGLGGKDSGVVTGAMNTAGLLGGTVCSLGIGYMVTAFHSYTIPVLILGMFLVGGGLLWLVIKAEP